MRSGEFPKSRRKSPRKNLREKSAENLREKIPAKTAGKRVKAGLSGFKRVFNGQNRRDFPPRFP
ncbi:MAG: hypothetical protein IBGAMO2_370002 [Arenicellales bacterium IbO2]|nr:MAG: hypothetical protein IBGAMO2_370002 [Arenicellales bacterium IbO2]